MALILELAGQALQMAIVVAIALAVSWNPLV